MKSKIFTLLLIVFMHFALNLHSTTVVVGPTGTYPSINMAITGQNALGSISEPLLIELQQGYNRPDTIIAVNGASDVNTVIIRPEVTATSIEVKSDGATSGNVVWLMNGCKYVTIDGRAGGTGSNVMTITADTLVGTSTTTALKKTIALKFVNDASYNTVQYLNLKSAVTLGFWRIGTTNAVDLGTIVFGDGITTGNSYNTIDNCDLGPLTAVSGAPSTAIYSKGLLTAPNTNLTISNNKIYDYYATDLNKASGAGIQVGSGVGVLLGANTSACTISDNSFYQTVQRIVYGNANGAKTGAIIIDNATNGSGFIVKNNYIGGSEPLCGGTNRYHNYIGNATGFNGIYISSSITTSSAIYGNTIKNIYLFAHSPIAQTYKSAGISINGGNVLVGIREDGITADANIIGDTDASKVGTTNASIIFTGSNSNAAFAGITFNSLAGANVKIANNKIAGICVNAYATTRTASFIGVDIIGTAQSTLLVDKNEIGNGATNIAPTSMSIQNYQGRNCFGIYMNSSGAATSTLTISNNKINNMYKSPESANTQTYVNGIWINTGVVCPVTISENEIRDLAFSAIRNNDTPLNWSSGITCGSQGTGSVIKNNTISNIEGISYFSSNVLGICLIPTVSASSMTASENSIFNLTSNVTRKTSQYVTGINGILTHSTGAFTPTLNVVNNMIRLGYDRSGNAVTSANTYIGIRDSLVSTAAANANYYNNTIYIGEQDVVTTDTVPTFGICFASLATNAVIRNFKNNLIINNRANATTGSGHFAIATGGGSTGLTNFISNNNDYVASGTGGYLGRFQNNSLAITLDDIKTYTGGDVNSIEYKPVLVNEATATPDLHLVQSDYSVNENLNYAALLTSPYDLDFDGSVRKSANRTIGADEFFGAVTAVENTVSKLFVSVTSRQAVVNGTERGQTISVYNAGGQLAKQIIARGQQTALNLNAGIYIIKANNQVMKVVL